MKLIYHRVGSAKTTSPFDEALQQVANNATLLRIASPFIGLGFLQRTIKNAHDWHLLSDVEAWLNSLNRKHRAHCWEFIADNLGRIRHVAHLHAKVAIGNDKLFLGSANFTEMGILGRSELSILVSEAEPVSEATAWFDALWEVASPPILEEGDALVSALDSMAWTQPKARVRLTTTAPKIEAVLAEMQRPAGFDLAGVMAKAGINESLVLESLEEAYQHFSEAWATAGYTFTFRELLDAVQHHTTGSSREVWELISADTASHWLGGLDPEGYDRFIYERGRFRLFRSPEDNGLAIRPARILNFVVDVFPMPPAHKPLPLEEAWFTVDVAEAHILPIVELLLDSGLLVEHDIPGELERYSLDPEFEWPHRWEKYTKAKNRFERMLKGLVDIPKPKAAKEPKPLERTVIWHHADADNPKPKLKRKPSTSPLFGSSKAKINSPIKKRDD